VDSEEKSFSISPLTAWFTKKNMSAMLTKTLDKTVKDYMKIPWNG
jgi:hypothetical protein